MAITLVTLRHGPGHSTATSLDELDTYEFVLVRKNSNCFSPNASGRIDLPYPVNSMEACAKHALANNLCSNHFEFDLAQGGYCGCPAKDSTDNNACQLGRKGGGQGGGTSEIWRMYKKDAHEHTLSLADAGSKFRGLAETVELAVSSQVQVEVEEFAGDFGFSRQVFFGDMTGKAIFDMYKSDGRTLMTQLKNIMRNKTMGRNVFIAKSDSDFGVEEEVARLAIRFRGAVNADYVAIVFDGNGFLDRSGKPGGNRNWSLHGWFQRKGMRVEFLDEVKAKELNVAESCDATLPSV